MPVTIKVNIDPNTILRNRHLENGGAAQKLMANEVLRFSDPYTPMDSSTLKSNVSMSNNGKQIIYNSPYARYQYYGKVMIGKAPKQVTDKDLVYDGAPMRGKYWVDRAMIDHIKDVEKAVASFVGGKAK